MAWVTRTNAADVYGVTEKQLYDEWFDGDGEQSFTEWLEAQYAAIAKANPDGDWEPKGRDYFQAMAKTIMCDAAESGDYNL